MRKKTIASKLLASALCACLLTFGWPTAVLAQNAVGGSATPDGAVAGTLPAGGSLEQTGPADGGLVPSAPTVAITGFADLPDDVAAQSHEVGELGGLDDLNLPATLEAAAEGGDALSVPVSGWASDPAFDPDAAGAYTFAPALDLPEDAALAQDATPPTVTVTLTEPVAMLAATPSTTVDSWTDLKSEVENPDGAAVIEIAGPLTATSKISVSRAVAIHSATGHIFTITRDSAFRSSFFDVADGDLTLQDVVLDGNKGVATNSSSLVNVNTGGKLTLGGGAALQNNKRTFGDGGGLVVMNGGHSIMQDGSSIAGNEVPSSGGGVNVVGTGSSFEMRGGKIIGNTAGSNFGGGVYVAYGATMKMSGTAQIGGTDPTDANTAESGGGVSVTDAGSSFEMTGGEIIGNTAGDFGGGVHTGAAATFTVQVGDITGNTAEYGGGVCVLGGAFNMNGGSLIGNAAASKGGGVYVLGAGRQLAMTDGALGNNTTGGAIGVGVETANGGTFTRTGGDLLTTVSDWAALKAAVEDADDPAKPAATDISIGKSFNSVGGAVLTDAITVGRKLAIHSATGGLFTITRGSGFVASLFSVTGGDLTLQDVVLDGNKGVIVTNSDSLVKVNDGGKLTLGGGAALQNNKRSFGYGGGVYVENGSHFVMQDGSGVTGNEIIDNGGGVYVTGAGSSFEMRGGRITGNKAGVNYGGGVYVGSGAAMKMSGAARIGGTAAGEANTAGSGGGVYVSSATGADSSFEMTGGEITGNTAGDYGGGVYVGGATFTMEDGGITGNTAHFGGGACMLGGGAFNMNGGSLIGNAAVSKGGGVYVGGGASMKTSGAARIGGTAAGEANTAQNGGGAYVTGAGSQLAMTGGLLAAQSGDAVYVGSAHSTFTVSGGTVMQTGENGRAIYSEGSTTDKVKVEGKAAVYSRGEAVAYEDASLSFPGPAGDGIVIKQTGDHAPYDAGSATDLERVPATAKAVWDTQGGSGGIVYENGENKGFLDLGVKVRQIAPVITTDSKLPDGAVGKAYSTTLAATGAPAPGWKVTDGALPDGLSLDRDSGEISGTPEQAGSFSFEVTAANGVSPDDSRTFGLAVRPPDYAMRTLTDKATGISVRGLFTDDAALAVAKDAALHPAGCPACDAIRAKQETDKLVALYGISLSAGFGKGDMEVRFPVSAEYDGKTVAILHCLDGALETVEAKAEGGATTGTFGGLSPFALFVPKDADPNPLPGPDSTSPQTGDGPSAAPFAALAFLSLLAAGLATLQLGRCRREDGSETE